MRQRNIRSLRNLRQGGGNHARQAVPHRGIAQYRLIDQGDFPTLLHKILDSQPVWFIF